MWRLRLAPKETKLPFISWRYYGYAVSTVIILGSLALLATRGLNFGIDFRGGLLMEIGTEGPAKLAEMRSIAGGLGLGEIQVQEFGAADIVMIRVAAQPGGDESQQRALEKLESALKSGATQNIVVRRTEVVGPKVGGELVRKGAIALSIALLMVLIYIWFRFEWQFALGAVAALAHDMISALGLFSLLQLDFSLSIVAALLTIVGYSVNDTVVIYDRIRENLRKYKKMDIGDLIDLSMNETLSRTVMTSMTVFIALLALYLFGGEVIRGFTFAMLWGVIEGTYSTIFIACPLLLRTGVKREWGEASPRSSIKQSR